MATATQKKPPEKEAEPATGRDGGTFGPPPPVGSAEEYAETALALGWAGAFGESCNRVEDLIRSRLLWEL